MDDIAAYKDFTKRLKTLIGKRPDIIKITLSNVFTMRSIGNKTHGDLAEVAIAEFVNRYMYDFRSIHVGKDLYRSKSREEDVKIINEITEAEFAISLKAYGDGPLQLSTDKNHSMFPRLEREGNVIEGKRVRKVLGDPVFSKFGINILPLIYDERKRRCNIMVFDYTRACESTVRIVREEAGRRRKHPVYRFYDGENDYVCEVRYGDAAANALQRGLWTHTRNGSNFFESITNGWIDFCPNEILVKRLSGALG